jgi:hypothetical protein
MSFLLLHNRNQGLVRPGLAAFYDCEKRNLLQRSEEFGNAVWGAGSVTSDAAISPRGDQTADEISDASAVAVSVFTQPVPVQSSTVTYTFSVFVKKDQDETRFPEFRIQPKGGTSEPLTAGQLNTKTGAHQIRTGSGSMMVSDEEGYWRVAVSEADTASGNTEVECSILPAFTDLLGGEENVELTGAVTVWGAQLNQGSTPLTYEKTDNNQTLLDVSGQAKHGQLGSTTGADTNDPLWTNRRLSFSGVDDYLLTPSEVTSGATALTLQVVFKKAAGSATSVQRVLFGHNLGGSYIRFFSDTSIGFWLVASVSSQFIQGPAGGITDDGLWKMMTFRWKSGTVQDQFLNKSNRLVFNESSPSEGTHTSTYRTIGMYDNSRYFDGEIASALLYRRLLTRAEVAQNYSWLKSTLTRRGIALA